MIAFSRDVVVWSRIRDEWERSGRLPIRELSYSPTKWPFTYRMHLVLEPGLEFEFDYEPIHSLSTEALVWHLLEAIVKETTPA